MAGAIAPAAITAGGSIASSLASSGKGKAPPRQPAPMPVSTPQMAPSSAATGTGLNFEKPLPPSPAIDPKMYAINKLRGQGG